MVQATAWFTGIDIQVVMTTGMPEEPFLTIGGNMEDRAKDCAGFPMWIGYKNNIYYQHFYQTMKKYRTQGRAGGKIFKKHSMDNPGKKVSQGIKSLKRKCMKKTKSSGIKSLKMNQFKKINCQGIKSSPTITKMAHIMKKTEIRIQVRKNSIPVN